MKSINSKRRNTNRINTKRRNTKRRNTKRINTKRRNTKSRNTKSKIMKSRYQYSKKRISKKNTNKIFQKGGDVENYKDYSQDFLGEIEKLSRNRLYGYKNIYQTRRLFISRKGDNIHLLIEGGSTNHRLDLKDYQVTKNSVSDESGPKFWDIYLTTKTNSNGNFKLRSPEKTIADAVVEAKRESNRLLGT